MLLTFTPLTKNDFESDDKPRVLKINRELIIYFGDRKNPFIKILLVLSGILTVIISTLFYFFCK